MNLRLGRWLKPCQRRVPATVVSAVHRVIRVVDAFADTAHLVTVEAMEAGRCTERRRYAALCGAEVIPASLTAPGRRSCPACARWITACQRELLRDA